jgi:hypothetical protein
LRRSNLQTVSVVVDVVALANSTAVPSTRTVNEPPSVSSTLVYAFGEGGVGIVVGVGVDVVVVVVVGVVGVGVVVVVAVGAGAGAGGGVVVGVVAEAGGGSAAVREPVLGWAGGLGDADSLRSDDPVDSAWLVPVSTCWVVVVTATVVVVVVWLGISDSTVETVVEVLGDSRAEMSPPSILGSSVAIARARIAAIPSAVGTSVTTLRTLLTAAAAMVTATMVATNQAIPT